MATLFAFISKRRAMTSYHPIRRERGLPLWFSDFTCATARYRIVCLSLSCLPANSVIGIIVSYLLLQQFPESISTPTVPCAYNNVFPEYLIKNTERNNRQNPPCSYESYPSSTTASNLSTQSAMEAYTHAMQAHTLSEISFLDLSENHRISDRNSDDFPTSGVLYQRPGPPNAAEAVEAAQQATNGAESLDSTRASAASQPLDTQPITALYTPSTYITPKMPSIGASWCPPCPGPPPKGPLPHLPEQKVHLQRT